MFDFMKRDPVKKAKKHVEKALDEIEAGYLDYASTEYEKAAKLFLQEDLTEFAVKYYREAANSSIEHGDYERAGNMKILAGEALLRDIMYDEAGSLYSDASDHHMRAKKVTTSMRDLGLSILSYLAARNFDTAVNMMKKAEKRRSKTSKKKIPMYDLGRISSTILCEGKEVAKDTFEKVRSSVKPNECELPLIDFVTSSVRHAVRTEVIIEWAGKSQEIIQAKTPIEFELRYKSPVPVRVADCKFSVSSSLVFTKQPSMKEEMSEEESWLFELNPVLSGSGSIGPFSMTLEGKEILVHKFSNKIEFLIAKAPPELSMELTPARISCGLGEETVLDVTLVNDGDGPADDVRVKIELTDGLEISVGGEEKSIQFLGAGERLHFQVYVRGIGLGDEEATVKLIDKKHDVELVGKTLITVD
jgi:hypothetical protein